MSPDFSLNVEKESSPQPVETASRIEVPKIEVEQPQEHEQKAIPKEVKIETETFVPVTLPPQPSKPLPQAVTNQKSPSLIAVEKILEEHVGDLFSQIPQDKRMKFKVQGEETAKKIDSLLHQTKVKVKSILSLLISWLRMIPGVSKFFIEQEAEMKVNKLLALRENQENKL
jgi:hypothetical protein